MNCPNCKAPLKSHPTLIGFDVAFFQCDSCKKSYKQSASIVDDLLGRPPLEQVDETGKRT